MENLLTDLEINEIIHRKINYPIFRNNNMTLSPKEDQSHTDVMAISEYKSLIMIRGNDDTGLHHIRARHNFWSTRAYTIQNPDGSKMIQNQSKFPDNITLVDELRIAEEVYSSENIIMNNIHPMADKFDLFIGKTQLKEKGEIEEFKLLLYMDTKIIHSIFPKSAKYNRKRVKKFPFYRGRVDVFRHSKTGIKQVLIPYRDLERRLSYAIFIEKFESNDKELISLLTYIDKGERFSKRKLTERKITYFKSDTHERINYQYSDLREVERIIINVENYKNSK